MLKTKIIIASHRPAGFGGERRSRLKAGCRQRLPAPQDGPRKTRNRFSCAVFMQSVGHGALFEEQAKIRRAFAVGTLREGRRLKPTLQAEARATIVLHHLGWARSRFEFEIFSGRPGGRFRCRSGDIRRARRDSGIAACRGRGSIVPGRLRRGS